MTIIESINLITWPAAAAIVGSVVTIVVGLFGYIRTTQPSSPSSSSVPTAQQATHDRISSLKDSVSSIEGDIKVLTLRVDVCDRRAEDHNARDVVDFRTLSEKIDKIMGIIVEILRDSNDQ